MQRVRTRLADVYDRFLASDPGLIRLRSALSTVCAVGLTLGALAALDAPVSILVTGALTAMVSTAAVTEPRPRDQALTLATGVPVALAAIAVGSALAPHRVTADVVFVLLIFAALYIRRLGPRATTLGIFAFQLFFVTQFVNTRVGQLPQLFLAVLMAFASSALVRFAVLRSSPGRTLARLQRAFGLRLGLVLDALIDVAEGGPQASHGERAVATLRRSTARLHTGALMVQNQLAAGTPDERTASAIQRRVAEAETAVERLAVLVLRVLRPGTDVDTLSGHRTQARLAGSAISTLDAATLPVLVSELRALRTAIGTGPQRPAGTDPAAVHNRLLGYRGDKQLPDASPAMQDVFRSAGELTRALIGLRLAVDGPTSAVRDTPETARSREESTAKDADPAKDAGLAEKAVPQQPVPRVRPTTRTALQVATGSALAVVGGELISPQRWYWAVFTCWVVFISTTSTGEILVRGYRRLLGTVAGVVAGLALAALIGDTPTLAFALAGLSVFGMYYTLAVSYTLMSFFVTTMIGMLYALLHTLTPGVLVVRIEETALGIACGLIAALLVLPVRTRERTDQLLHDALERLRAVLSQSLARLGGESGGDLLDPARALDAALDSLRHSAQPLITPISPLRSRRRTALCVLGLLETAAFHARSLAATAELVPAGLHIGTDPSLMDEARRIDRNLTTLISQVALRDKDGTTLVRGPGIPTPPAVSEGEARAEDINATRRVLRHLQRVDESIQGLARTLHLHVRDGS
ncbi:FUSC family protein [Streptomyces flavofungini]|uniref:FUSC family protein n=1 Tax=Streptomyces flavofungini TaxID=68200 RepID=A0ABS0X4D9_9ACTN|nr:FUSC family protein [Streptomyces flavofungini]MBJ3808046.1 FUSC family protein [Streptomyces flavofungini]GHC83134.1 membrane protein [Streptomyces flavofungini]